MKMSLRQMIFSCRMCFSSLSSRYVRFASTGVLNGFMTFLIATDVSVSLSCPLHTRPKAPMPTGCKFSYRVVISNTVPKMDSLIKSAIVDGGEPSPPPAPPRLFFSRVP